ncbi:ribonuclease H-like domain-containing protein, partial [Lentinula raphanica]
AAASPTPAIGPLNHRRPRIAIPLSTPLDHLQHAIFHSDPPSLEDQLLTLYGNADPARSPPLKVYTDGSCLKPNTSSARAGIGIFVGPSHALNLSSRVCGPQRNNRAELLAILAVIQRTPLARPLEIFTDSTYAISSLVFLAPANAQCGWVCPNGDILQVLVQWIASRSTPLRLTHVRAHRGHLQNEMADRLAKEGA